MNEEINFIDEMPKIAKKEDNNTNTITPPTWSIEPPLEIKRNDDEL